MKTPQHKNTDRNKTDNFKKFDKSRPSTTRPKPSTDRAKPSADRSKQYNDRPKSFGNKPTVQWAKPAADAPRPHNNKPKSFGNDRPKPYGDKPKLFGGERPKPLNGYQGNNYAKPVANYSNKPRVSTVKKTTIGTRLNKFIANSGICSRREADELIRTGLVEVNGKVLVEMGFLVQSNDEVRFDGNKVTPEKLTYVLLNKPKGFISTSNDEKARKTVLDLVQNSTPYRIYPVGRLDRQTTGVLLLTNDGDLTKKLTHPSHNIKKIYHVSLDKKLTSDDLEKIKLGVRLFEGVAMVDNVSYVEGAPKTEVGLEIHIGWNRVVRRIFTKLGYEVEKLDRVSFAGLTKKNIKRGDWRILDPKEVSFLKMMG